MSYILFCKEHTANKPFYIADLRKNIYTIEELCYYIYCNPSLCKEELLSPRLFSWIGSELKLVDLSESMKTLIQKNPEPAKVASQIFAYADYLTKPQREAVCERIRKYSLLSIYERKKMRADSYVAEKNYREAIIDYEEILEKGYCKNLKEEYNILYNMGCCYGALFYYDLAYGWFMKAADKQEDSQDACLGALFCKRMTLSEEDYEEFLKSQEELASLNVLLEEELSVHTKDFYELPEMVSLSDYQSQRQIRDSAYDDFMKKKISQYKAEC